MAVCHSHDLRSLAPFRFPNLRAPFLAGAKLAVNEGFLHIQSTSDLEIFGKSFQNSPSSPIAESVDDRSGRTDNVREHPPKEHPCAAPTECRSVRHGDPSMGVPVCLDRELIEE
jgi:hypothetical protein